MIQCQDCEHFVPGPGGQFRMTCDPFRNVKEPECLTKWQLIKLDVMVQAYQATVAVHQRLAPLQEKMFKHMQREIDEMDESEKWRDSLEDDPLDDEDPSDPLR